MKHPPPLPESQGRFLPHKPCIPEQIVYRHHKQEQLLLLPQLWALHKPGSSSRLHKHRKRWEWLYHTILSMQSFHLITRRRVYFSSTIKQPEGKREGEGELLLCSVWTLTEAPVRCLCKWVLMKACVTCIHLAGRQTCLFCIWFDAADEEWVGSTKRGHQGMERILKSSKTKPKGSVTTGGKWLHLMQ